MGCVEGRALFSEGVHVEPQEARDGDSCVDGIFTSLGHGTTLETQVFCGFKASRKTALWLEAFPHSRRNLWKPEAAD